MTQPIDVTASFDILRDDLSRIHVALIGIPVHHPDGRRGSAFDSLALLHGQMGQVLDLLEQSVASGPVTVTR